MEPDPFAILGLPRQYELDRAELQRAYLSRAALAHPDLASGPEAPDAAPLNRAKQTLEDPERRARALLELLAAEAGITFDAAADRALPPVFLMEMMETREQMETDRQSGDAAAMATWGIWAEERRANHQSNVATLFAAAAERPDPTTLRAIKQELNCWRYVERMIEQLSDA